MAYEAILGFDPERWQCGRPLLVVAATGQSLTCGSYLVEWVPRVHVRMPGFDSLGRPREAECTMGALAMCASCKRTFSWAEVEKTAIWQGMVSGLEEEWGEVRREELPNGMVAERRRPLKIERRHVEIVWVSAADFVKESRSMGGDA